MSKKLMSKKLNLHNPENAKKLAKKISKVADVSHSAALNVIAKELGFTDWHHYIKVCGAKSSEKSLGLKLMKIPIDVEYDSAVFTGLHEVMDAAAGDYRYRVIVDSKTQYLIDENADKIIAWLRIYSKDVDYKFVLENLEIERGFPTFGFSLEFYLTTGELSEAKVFADAFFTFLNSLIE